MHPVFRTATKQDLPQLVSLLADDPIGINREDPTTPINQHYFDAFQQIDMDPNNSLIVIEQNQCIVGMMQLTFIPYLTHIGSWRCLIEGVRIEKKFRGNGLGKAMIQWAINKAKQKPCGIVQLTTDKQRPDAIKFYQTLGFKVSHEGLKLAI